MVHVKLTDSKGKTRALHYNECQWGEGVTHEAKGHFNWLCSSGWIHFYSADTQEEALALALLRDAVDAEYTVFDRCRAWLCAVEDTCIERFKSGAKKVTTVREIDAPVIPDYQYCVFALRLALRISKDPKFIEWATAWLDGSDRSEQSAAALSAAYYGGKESATTVVGEHALRAVLHDPAYYVSLLTHIAVDQCELDLKDVLALAVEVFFEGE